MLPTNANQQLAKSVDRPLRVDLLGVPIITWRGTPLDLSRRQARAILFRLACAEKPLGREKVADLLWPEKEPSIARRNLVRLLSLLRAELPQKNLLRSDNTAVWLNPEESSCDVREFMQLSKGNDLVGWQSAVSLYRGPFLSGFVLDKSPTFADWQQAEEYNLERHYLECLARLVKKMQALGETAEAIAYARRYLAIDELAETIHRALIALYAARGERTAALQQYSRCVEILHNELGVDPLPETRAVYEAARDGNLAPKPLPVPEPTWSTLPGLEIPLTGREQAWAELEEAYRSEKSGGAILIGGEPGVGKSRLMQEFASSQGVPVLVGNCHTGSQALFFQPLVQALRQGLIGADQGRQVKRIWLAELSVLLPELRDQVPDLPAPLPLEPAQSQARLLEALTQAFSALAGESHLLLCLDDLHAADEGTLAWLNYTTGQLAGSGVCIVATYRTQEKDILAGWQRALSRRARGSHIHLQSLDSWAVQSLVELAGMPQGTAVALAPRLHEATGGNAYFLLETIRELLESGGLLAQPVPLPLPQTVREAVLRRADRLPPLARQVLDMAAVLSPLLEVSLLAETSARGELDVAGALDDLVRRQLLVPDGSRFRFQHDLTREAIYREISDWRTRLLHRRAAQVLEQRHERQPEYTAVIARHYEEAGDYAQAIAGYRQAALEAQAINAFQIAAGHLRRALQLLPTGEETASLRTDLLERLGDCQRLGGRFDAALSRYQEALFFTVQQDSLSRARILRKAAETLWPIDRPLDAIDNTKQAEVLLKPLLEQDLSGVFTEWVNVHLVMAYAYYWTLDLHGIQTSLLEIRQLTEEPGFTEQKQRYQVYAALAEIVRSRYRLDSRLVDISRQHYESAKQTGNLYLIAETAFRLGFITLWSGDPAAAREHLAYSLSLCEEFAVHFLWVQNATYLMVAAHLMGDVAAVAGLYPRAWQITKKVGTKAYLSMMQSIGAWLAYREGDMVTAETAARDAEAIWQQVAVPFEWLARWVLLAIALQEERIAEAVKEARIMTTPPQALLADAVNEALQTAVSLWDSGEATAARQTLARARRLAEEANYL